MKDAPEVPVLLDEQERHFLRSALLDWGGPATPTNALAAAMGFTDAESLSSEAWALWKRIEVGETLAADDWRRVLLAAEIVFASDVVGSGLDWKITSGLTDTESVSILRGLRRKLPRWRGSVQFAVSPADAAVITDADRPNP